MSPNPTFGTTFVALESRMVGPVSLALYDVVGRARWRGVARVPATGGGGGAGEGASAARGVELTLDAGALPSGVYLLRAAAVGGETAVHKLVVER